MAKPRKKTVVHRVHTQEFKTEAVRQLEARTGPAEEVALKLGVKRNQLYKWQKELEEGGKGASGMATSVLSERGEIERLRRELARAQEQLEILKKAEAYLAKLRGQGTR
jgi:transposase